MKKLLAFLLVAVFVVSSGACVAFAAPSVEAEGIISGITAIDSDKAAVDITVEKIDSNVKKPFYDALQGLKSETKDTSLKVVGHYDMGVEGEPEYPLSVTLDVLGISKSSNVYVLVQKGKEVIAVTPTVMDGKIAFDIDEPSDKFAIVVDNKTASKVEKENDVLSPQTADVTSYVFVALAIMALAFVLVPKKVKA